MPGKAKPPDLYQNVKQLTAKDSSLSVPWDYENWQYLLNNGSLESLPVGIAILNTDFVLLRTNPAYSVYLGRYSSIEPERALGRCYFNLIPGSESQLGDWFREVRGWRRSETRYDYRLRVGSGNLHKDTFWDAHVSSLVTKTDETTGILIFCLDVTEKREALNSLKERDGKIKNLDEKLQDNQSALKIMLGAKEELRKEIEGSLAANTNEVILPLLYRLKASVKNERQRALIDEIESSLLCISGSFATTLSSPVYGLTPREILVASLTKAARTSKEIADMLGVTAASIDFHRKNVRRKLGIAGEKTNLQSFLMSF